MKLQTPAGLLAVTVLMAGCTGLQLSNIVDTSADEMDLRPPDAEPGVCYGRVTAPAVIETVTEHKTERAATYDDAGGLITPAAYRTETLQRIVKDREFIWFKRPCQDETVEDYEASVQRALKARGHYHGRITGEFDFATRLAIRKYQGKLGLDSPTLSLENARRLGLVVMPRDKPPAEKG